MAIILQMHFLAFKVCYHKQGANAVWAVTLTYSSFIQPLLDNQCVFDNQGHTLLI